MPSIASHIVTAKIISKNLDINDDNFIRGNILPDVISRDKRKTHHRINGKLFLVPDIDYFKKTLDFNNMLELGYYTHVLLDKYYLDDFLVNNVGNSNIFNNFAIYSDYSVINDMLIEKYKLDLKKLERTLLLLRKEGVDENLLKMNIAFLFNGQKHDTHYIDLEQYDRFLYDTSFKIAQDIKSKLILKK